VQRTHVKLNRAFKVIPGHPCWCRQKSRTVCGRNVQLMPTLCLKRTKIMATCKTANPSISATPLKFDDAQHETSSNIYIHNNGFHCQKLEALINIFAADGICVRLLFFTQLSLKLNPVSLKLLVRKPSFT